MTNSEIIDYIKGHPAGKVKIAFTDLDGILRGKYIATEKFLSVAENGLGVCDVIFGWDMGDMAYADAPASLDLSTFRKIPWENDLPFFLGEMNESPEKANFVCPRQLLKK